MTNTTVHEESIHAANASPKGEVRSSNQTKKAPLIL